MIPIKLKLTRFLSYHHSITLDFSGIHLACISGLNGAGKSSILDAITWALFGESRSKSHDDVVNRSALKQTKKAEAEVRFDFKLRETIYRVIRRKQPRKTMSLELQIMDSNEEWKPLTESKLQETQAKIQKLLNMNYDTFINASFFLQGKADEFTTKTANKRKEILADLLGVSRWEKYKEVASTKSKKAKMVAEQFELRLAEDEAKLSSQTEFDSELERVEEVLKEIRVEKKSQEALLKERQKVESAARQQRELFEKQRKEVQIDLNRFKESQQKQEEKQKKYQNLLAQEKEIETEYQYWQELEKKLLTLQDKSTLYQEIQEEKKPLEFAFERKKNQCLQQEKELLAAEKKILQEQEEKKELNTQLSKSQQALNLFQENFEKLEQEQELYLEGKENCQAFAVERKRLIEDQEKLKSRIVRLQESVSGTCPLCDQDLTTEHRTHVLEKLAKEGKEFALKEEQLDQEIQLIASNLKLSAAKGALRKEFENKFVTLKKEKLALEKQQQKKQQEVANQQKRLSEIEEHFQKWEADEKKLLLQIQETIRLEQIEPELFAKLKLLEIKEKELDYQPKEYQLLQQQRKKQRNIQSRFNELKQAQEIVKHLTESLGELNQQIEEKEKIAQELKRQQEEFELQTTTDSLKELESDVQRLKEEEALATEKIGALKQQIKNLVLLQQNVDKLRKDLTEQRVLIQRLELLDKACGRNGIQALLIEQAIPELEDHANELLSRLTHGEMRVSFETQRKLKTRDEQVETLDIQIVDSSGERPYENFSGGEQFRVNFALRLALSKILAKRAGAKLQTLVIDEGFGSQDPRGLQRLIEAINTIQSEFECILVITHMDELRDIFPTQIMVEKGSNGSTISVTSN